MTAQTWGSETTARRHGKSRSPYMTTQITHTVAAGAIAFTVATIVAEATQ